MSKELESSSTAEESYSDDDDIRGIILSLNFPNEAYHLEYTDIKTNTPQILPNISLTGTPKSGIVKAKSKILYPKFCVPFWIDLIVSSTKPIYAWSSGVGPTPELK